MTNPKEITREEMVEAMARVIAPNAYWGDPDTNAEQQEALATAKRCIAVLNPLLERVATSLEPFSGLATRYVEGPEYPDCWRLERTVTVGDLRQAASLHSELKDLIK